MTPPADVDHQPRPPEIRRDATVGRPAAERRDRGTGRDAEDAAAVIAILSALAAASGEPATEPATRSVWADPAYRLGLRPLAPTGWWASGLPR